MTNKAFDTAANAASSREHFASRIGFILIAAGCAIGIGNVWRFPYITGEYGGGAFVLLYLVFLVILGLPVMVMEFAVGRASQKSAAQAFDILEPKRRFHWFSWWGYIGCMLLMMFYTTVAGWMLAYIPKMATGTFDGASTEVAGSVFNALLANPSELIGWMIAAIAIGFAVGEAVYAAMGQAFFSLSLGIAAMEIFGSYINKDRRLMSEAVSVTALNTVVAILAGLIIFPACFAYGVTPDSGPSLVFVTLPLVFAQMPLGSLWGALFFIFMSFAALSTVIAVFENLISFSMDKWEISRRRAVAINGILVLVLSLPCALGFNVLSDVTIPAIGDIQSIEDFIVSNNMLPLGALVFVLFCTRRYGWGWDNFLKEADTGIGIKFPAWSRIWVSYGIPVLIVIIFIMGYAPKIAFWLGLS